MLLSANALLGIEVGGNVGAVDLATLDGRRLTMANYADRTATAVLFLSSRCDATRSALDAINRINGSHRLRGVLLVGVFPNPAELEDEVRTFSQRSGLIFPVYRDPDGKAAQRFGARVTPEAFLIDRTGVLRYCGSISGLAPAVTSLLAKQPIEATNLPAGGTPIGAASAKREMADPYGSISFSSELIFETIPGAPAHHASTIAEAANGDLLAVWYGGSYESADDQALFLSRRAKGARSWSKPEVLVRDSLRPPGNAVVFKDGLDRIWVVWARMDAARPLRRGGGWGQTRLLYRISSDNGTNWTADQPFTVDIAALPRNPPIPLSSGRLLLPLSAGGAIFLESSDHGKTWRQSNAVAGGGQPAVAERRDGSLLALLRKGPRIMQSESRDGGITWSPVTPAELRNPDSGISMVRLRNGDLVLVFNDSETSRTPLNIARSTDGGRTWEKPLALETNPGEYSYPCVIQGSDGRIHVTYTFRRYSIKHVELDEGWLVQLGRPN